jgi:hypothetical protein
MQPCGWRVGDRFSGPALLLVQRLGIGDAIEASLSVESRHRTTIGLSGCPQLLESQKSPSITGKSRRLRGKAVFYEKNQF